MASVRPCSPSTLDFFWDLHPNSLRETPTEDSAKPVSFSYRAGDLNRHLVVLRERRESKKEIHVAILSIAKPFWGLHNEQGKT